MPRNLKILFDSSEKKKDLFEELGFSGLGWGVGGRDCIHVFVGEAAAVRILVNLGRQSKCVASSQSSKATVPSLRWEGARTCHG